MDQWRLRILQSARTLEHNDCSTLFPRTLYCSNARSSAHREIPWQLNSYWICFYFFSYFGRTAFSIFFANKKTNQGRQGCKNVRAGGDTVDAEIANTDSRFMTYIVYRSFKNPPPITRIDVAKIRGVWHNKTQLLKKKQLHFCYVHSVPAHIPIIWYVNIFRSSTPCIYIILKYLMYTPLPAHLSTFLYPIRSYCLEPRSGFMRCYDTNSPWLCGGCGGTVSVEVWWACCSVKKKP